MSLTVGQITIFNRWGSEVDPAIWVKSSILDLLKITVNITSTTDIDGGELMFLPAMFREVGTVFTGNTRPQRGFYIPYDAAGGTVDFIETSVINANSNFTISEVEFVSDMEFNITFEFRLLADRNDFINTVTMDSIDSVTKSSINSANQFENIVASVYNKVKELQLYVYIKDAAGDEFVTLVRQQVQANYYGGHAPFSFDENDFCALNGVNNFAFTFAPDEPTMDNNFQKMLFESLGQNTSNYEIDLNFSDTIDGSNSPVGAAYTFAFSDSDYDTNFYTAIVYNFGGQSYTQIEDLLSSNCFPTQPDSFVFGHIADYTGGVSQALTTPCSDNLTIQKNLSPTNHWWTSSRPIKLEVGFDGGVAPSYPGGAPAYVGVFPIGGEIVETVLGVPLQGWFAKAVPVGIFEFQHNVVAATMATNFMNHINTNFPLEWTATIGFDPRVVVMEKVAPVGYQSSQHFLGYKVTGATPFASADLVYWGTDLSSFIIVDNTIPSTTTILFTDVPFLDSKADLIDYINNNTIYNATDEGAAPDDIKVCMPEGVYVAADVATSSIELITALLETANIENFTGGGTTIEDFTVQVVTERLCAVAKWYKAQYDNSLNPEFFTDTDTDLNLIEIIIGGLTYSANRSGAVWVTNNPRFTVTEDATFVTAQFCFRGLFPNDQGIVDWSGTSQIITWEFILEYTEPRQYTKLTRYFQEVEFRKLDDATDPPNEVVEFITLFKEDGVTSLNNICNETTVVCKVNTYGATAGAYKIVAAISPEPFGVSLESEQGMEEEDSFAGNLVQLSSDKIFDIVEDLDNTPTTASFKLDVSELNKDLKYRIYAIAYKQ